MPVALVRQHRQHRPGDVRYRGAKGPHDILAAELRAGPLQSGHDMQPQPSRIIITAVQAHPGKRPVLHPARRPLSHRNRLAETRRRLHQHQLARWH